eukprot:TRINITY_DN90701_c0_g1_i1.p1 TRINITY_DN90701_c0_g1~~TRINITY_DN90701_c0_g1_i1.p1  ORF type:complete len:228 (-),score=73.93 TRINITY_DN90701_c0_g1_i1:120-773(-)
MDRSPKPKTARSGSSPRASLTRNLLEEVKELENLEQKQRDRLAGLKEEFAECEAVSERAAWQRRRVLCDSFEQKECESARLATVRSAAEEARSADAFAKNRLRRIEEERQVEVNMVALQEQQQKHLELMKGESDKQQSMWLERARRLREFVSEGRESQEKLRTELLESQREADAARAAVAVNCKLENEVVRRQLEIAEQKSVLETEEAEAERLGTKN